MSWDKAFAFAQRHKTMYPPQVFYSVMCPRGDKTAHVVIMGSQVDFYRGMGWVEQYRLKVKEWHNETRPARS